MSRPSEILLKKPSLPSLLSTRAASKRSLAPKAVIDDARSEIFTPSQESATDYFGEIVTIDLVHQTHGEGIERAEDPRVGLLATLQRSKVARQASSTSVGSKSRLIYL